ncbi:MAG: hydrogenase maturation protease, partial [Methanomicrobiales archaeon]|nr:hydrogenase maturation protease [Methanomicrobiales archaeon]
RSFRRKGWLSLDCGTAPENFTSVVRKAHPELVILVDAAEMHLRAGEFRSIPFGKIADVSIGTHGPSLNAFLHFISTFIPHILFIGIQPERFQEAQSLTESVQKGADRLIKILLEDSYYAIPVLQE